MDKTDANVSGYVKDCKKSFLHLPLYTDCPYYVFVRKSLSFYHAMVRQKMRKYRMKRKALAVYAHRQIDFERDDLT